jgi:hypothetical protein
MIKNHIERREKKNKRRRYLLWTVVGSSPEWRTQSNGRDSPKSAIQPLKPTRTISCRSTEGNTNERLADSVLD